MEENKPTIIFNALHQLTKRMTELFNQCETTNDVHNMASAIRKAIDKLADDSV